jgi:tricorn protease-like protein
MFMRKILFTALLITGFFSTGISSLSAATKHALTFDDLMKVQRVADPQISPDGKWVAYAVTVVDKEKNTRKGDIWIVPTGGG